MESNKKNIGMDFTTGPVMPLLIRFFVPFLLANLLNSIYNTVDTIVIGQFVGSTGIVAVNMGGKMLGFFTLIGTSFSGSGQVLIAQLTGAKRKKDISETVGTLFTSMIIISIIAGILLYALAVPVLNVLNTPAESFDAALEYLLITCFGIPLMFGYNAVSAVLRGMGDSKSPLIFIAIAAGFNLIGDLIFVALFNMGAAGTAIATVMGQGLSLIISIIHLYRHRESFGFDFKLKSFAIEWTKMKIIFKIGFPMALRGMFINGFQLVMMGFINTYGVTEAAAYSIADKFYHMANIFVTSVSQGGSGMIAQNIGAGKQDRVKLIMRSTVTVSASAAALLSIISLLFPRQIYGLFTSEEAVLAYAAPFMAICCLVYFMGSIMGMYDGVVQGTGASMLSFLGGFLDGVVFRLCFGLLFGQVLGMGVVGFFMGEGLARLGPLMVGLIYYHSGAWKRKKKLIES